MSIFCFRRTSPGEEVEQAATICRLGDQLLWGTRATGTPTSVKLRIGCPHGGKPVGIFHTHPGGTSDPSPQDVAEFRRASALRGINKFCIKNGELRCFELR